MIRFVTDQASCGSPITRREWLRIGGLAGLANLAAGALRGRRPRR